MTRAADTLDFVAIRSVGRVGNILDMFFSLDLARTLSDNDHGPSGYALL